MTVITDSVLDDLHPVLGLGTEDAPWRLIKRTTDLFDLPPAYDRPVWRWIRAGEDFLDQVTDGRVTDARSPLEARVDRKDGQFIFIRTAWQLPEGGIVYTRWGVDQFEMAYLDPSTPIGPSELVERRTTPSVVSMTSTFLSFDPDSQVLLEWRDGMGGRPHTYGDHVSQVRRFDPDQSTTYEADLRSNMVRCIRQDRGLVWLCSTAPDPYVGGDVEQFIEDCSITREQFFLHFL